MTWNYKPPTILTYDEFLEMYDIPESKSKSDQDTLYKKWLISAQDQLNSVSNGRLYADFPNLDDTDEQTQKEIYIVKTCIGDWLEYMIITAKTFADQDKTINSNVPYSLKSKAIDGNVEQMRSDILIKFANTRWYKMSSSVSLNQQNILQEEQISVDEFALLVKKLKSYLLSIEGDNKMNGDLWFEYNGIGTAKKIMNSGDIVSYASNNNDPKPAIRGYDFVGQIAESENANKILDPIDLVYKAMTEWNPNVFNSYTRDQVNNIISTAFNATGISYQLDFKYPKNFLVFVIDEIETIPASYYYYSKQDNNIGHQPVKKQSDDWWLYIPEKDIPVSEIVDMLKPFIGLEITKQINELPTVEIIDKEIFEQELAKKANLAGGNIFTGGENQFVERVMIGGVTTNPIVLLPDPQEIKFVGNQGIVSGLKEPTLPTEAASKAYVDSKTELVEFRANSDAEGRYTFSDYSKVINLQTLQGKEQGDFYIHFANNRISTVYFSYAGQVSILPNCPIRWWEKRPITKEGEQNE